MQQKKQQFSPQKSIRYRKISMSGATVATFNHVHKPHPNGILIEFPPLDSNENLINPKIVEEQYYKKCKLQKGVKTLLRAYDESKKKNSEEGMQALGLDIIRIQAVNPDRYGEIWNTKSQKRANSKKVIHGNVLSPVKQKSARFSRNRNSTNEGEQSPEIDMIEMTESATSLKRRRESPHFKFTSYTNTQKPLILQSQESNSKMIAKTKFKPQEYLYKKLEGTQKLVKEEQNLVYEKRIKSYLEFLWKLQFAHNIYINLDLKHDDINNRPRKYKAYIAPGNNGAMVRGLLKRRFWWQIAEERTSDCDFVWTQLKINDLFEHQKRCVAKKAKYKDDDDEQQDRLKKAKKLRLNKFKMSTDDLYNAKLMNQEDCNSYKKYLQKYQMKGKQRDYTFRSTHVLKELEQLESQHFIHNHLPQNFYLGNKKALFHNLKEYYGLIKQNVYDYIPLTFHIKKGIKDPQYVKFIDYYKKRAKTIKRQQKDEQEEGTTNKNKTRNIWIVKPGENSNQGRGITVIDQIYELNSLLKEGERSQPKAQCGNNDTNPEEVERTFIVQMYIDRPFLYNNRKFDIRHYMLITNFFGVMRAYWYEEGYIRTSSYEFNIDNFEPQIHLTNDAVQKRYPDYHKYEPYNKISYDQFQRYLDLNHNHKKYNFKQTILPAMKKMATDAAKSVFTKICPKNQMNNFEVFGLDFMIDRHFRPWLIEINTNPCLEVACPLLNKIIPYMIEQSFKLTIDLTYPPPSHYPNTCKHFAPLVSLEIFKYELIFDSLTQGQYLQKLYRRVRSNLIEEIGQIEDDEEFKDEGKEIKLDDFT